MSVMLLSESQTDNPNKYVRYDYHPCVSSLCSLMYKIFKWRSSRCNPLQYNKISLMCSSKILGGTINRKLGGGGTHTHTPYAPVVPLCAINTVHIGFKWPLTCEV